MSFGVSFLSFVIVVLGVTRSEVKWFDCSIHHKNKPKFKWKKMQHLTYILHCQCSIHHIIAYFEVTLISLDRVLRRAIKMGESSFIHELDKYLHHSWLHLMMSG